ncbi:MAG: hypothetical protein HJJLKODD_02912 [Phycisphaerae bacterium]|nr:hypothetical protein [Phycisphaerae bacterium]
MIKCIRCGYNLHGLDLNTNCPECGLPRILCNTCGASLINTPEYCHNCKNNGHVSEWSLIKSFIFPWNTPKSGFWLSIYDTSYNKSARKALFYSFLIWCSIILLGFIGFRVQWIRVSVNSIGKTDWTWRADTTISHWAEFLPRGELYGNDLVFTRVYYKGSFTKLLLGCDSKIIANKGRMKTLNEDIKLSLLRWSKSWIIPLLYLTSHIILYTVLICVPPIGLYCGLLPSARIDFLANGMRRARWIIIPNLLIQGILLFIFQIYDLLILYIGFPYLGTSIIGIEVTSPFWVCLLFYYRAIGFDRQKLVFGSKLIPRMLILGGFIVCLITATALSSFIAKVVN